MSKHNQKGRRKSGPPFVMLRCDLMDSAAWGALSCAQRCILFQIQRAYNGQNNGFLGASVDSLAHHCNISPKTVTKGIKTLIDFGFIERMQEGSFAFKARHAAEYRLTYFKCDRTGRPASDAFKKLSLPATGGALVGD